MKKYLLVYTGGTQPASREEGEMVMKTWIDWMKGLGENLVDGGFPIQGDHMVVSGQDAMTSTLGVEGYSVVKAADMKAALEIAKSCPHASVAGGMVHVQEEYVMVLPEGMTM